MRPRMLTSIFGPVTLFNPRIIKHLHCSTKQQLEITYWDFKIQSTLKYWKERKQILWWQYNLSKWTQCQALSLHVVFPLFLLSNLSCVNNNLWWCPRANETQCRQYFNVHSFFFSHSWQMVQQYHQLFLSKQFNKLIVHLFFLSR